MPNGSYGKLLHRIREIGLLQSTAALLHWDQQTMMPPRGIEHRSRQLAQLARMSHELFISVEIADLLAQCEAESNLISDPLSESAVNVRETRREYDRAVKVPASLVQELSQTTALAEGEWIGARKESDFPRFRPWLEKIVGLLRQKAECLGHPKGGEAWDALAEGFEPDCTARKVEAMFSPLRARLADLVGEIVGRGAIRAQQLQSLDLPIEINKKFVRAMAQRIGVDFSRGRLDESAHPFCGGSHCHDVRMTTRFTEADQIEPLFSTLHESGHAMYEQGLKEEHLGTPMGESISLAIHESQSRMWENFVGRTREFWIWCLPQMKKAFGASLNGITEDDAYADINPVRPGLIRVSADEATYNLHIIIRFEMERSLMGGDLPVSDLPGVWNEKYRDILSVDVPDEAQGCLQDIHWAGGAIGYFPTYALGNLYAAQIFEQAEAEIPDLRRGFSQGRFSDLKEWLNERIHSHGKRFSADALCQRLTEKPLSIEPFMNHLENKLRPLHGL
jgi:carboxypeptidase Taq